MQYPGQGVLPRDQNSIPATGAASLTDINAGTVNAHVLPLVIDDATNRLLVTSVVTSMPAVTGSVHIIDASGDDINWADVPNNAIRVNIVAGGAGDGAILDGVNSAIKATVFDYTNSNPMGVVLRDTNGDYVSVGGGTQYAIDAVAGGSDVGNLALVVRDDALATLTPVDGDYTQMRTNSRGALWITPDGVVTVNGSIAHDAAGAAIAPVLVGGYASAAAPSDVSADNDAVRAWYLRNGAQATVLTAAGALIGGDAANGLDVDVTRLPALVAGSAIIGNVRIDQTTPGTTNAVSLSHLGSTAVDTNNGAVSAGTQRVTLANNGTGVLATVTTVTTVGTVTNITNWGNIVDNAAFTDGTTRILMNGYVFDDVAGTALTENDGAAARINANRAQVYVQEDGATRGRYSTVTTRGSTLLEGPTASDAALAASPVTTGGRASAAEPSAMSADGDVVDVWLDRKGRQVVTMQAATGTQTSVASSATNVTLLASNTSRKGAIFFNDSTSVCYVRLAATATSSNFSYKMDAGSTLEIPFGYTGIVDGIWVSATGNMRVTEIT